MAISLNSLQRYALKVKCPVVQQGSVDTITKLGLVNRRPLDPKSLAKEMARFAVFGDNANQLDMPPFRVNVPINVQKVQKAFNGIKFGAFGNVVRFVVNLLGRIPILDGRAIVLDSNKDIVLTSSKLRIYIVISIYSIHHLVSG